MEIPNEENDVNEELIDVEDIFSSIIRQRMGKHTHARELRHMHKHQTPSAIRRKRAKRKIARHSRQQNRK